MRTTIGVSIGARSVHAVSVRGADIVWSASADIGDASQLAAVIGDVLHQCPAIRRGIVSAAFGPAYVRVKRLHGLEGVTRAHLVTEAARTCPERYFREFDGGSSVTGAIRSVDGAWYAASLAKSAIAATSEACETLGAELAWLVPAGAALPSELHGLVIRQGRDVPEPFADAHRAAHTRSNMVFALPSAARTRRQARTRARLRIALAACVALTAIAAIVAPVKPAELQRREAARALAHEREPLGALSASVSELGRVSKRLNDIDAFGASRRSMLGYLSALATALPESTAVLSLRADAGAATIVLITRAGPSVIESLSAIANADAPQILGAFTREQVGGIEVERIATRSRFTKASAKSRSKDIQ